MLYKILLSLDYRAVQKEQLTEAFSNLISSNWQKVNDSNQIWKSEIIAYDLLSAKIRVERDLSQFFQKANIPSLSYAFQLSLGDVSTGVLKNIN